MRIHNVISMPTSINAIHQSCFRSDALLRLVREWLELGVSAQVLIQVIDELNNWSSIQANMTDTGKLVIESEPPHDHP